MKVLVAQSYLTLCSPMDRSPPGSSVHGIFQARILEWVAMSFSRESSWPRDQTQVSCVAGRFFNHLSHIREDLNVRAKTITLRRKERYKHHNLEFGNGILVMMLKAKERKENCTYIQFLQNQKCLSFKGYHQYNVNQTYSRA